MHTRRQEVRPSQPRHTLSIAAGVAMLAITVAACESDNTRTDTDSHATPAAEVARQQPVTDTPNVSLPDLTDPAVRKQFACTFADGYFGDPQPDDDARSDCE